MPRRSYTITNYQVIAVLIPSQPSLSTSLPDYHHTSRSLPSLPEYHHTLLSITITSRSSPRHRSSPRRRSSPHRQSSPSLPDHHQATASPDFVDEVTNDLTRSATNHIEIITDINIEEEQFSSSDIIVKPIRTRIRAYVPQATRELYVPSAFVYADGRFSTIMKSDGELEITIHALSLMR
jgi:hypothetical protein